MQIQEGILDSLSLASVFVLRSLLVLHLPHTYGCYVLVSLAHLTGPFGHVCWKVEACKIRGDTVFLC